MRKEGKKKSLEIWQEQFFPNNKIRTTHLFFILIYSPAFGNTEPAVWFIFNCFSSEYFFLRILKLEKRIFRGSLRERPALFCFRAHPPTPTGQKIPFLKPFLVN